VGGSENARSEVLWDGMCIAIVGAMKLDDVLGEILRHHPDHEDICFLAERMACGEFAVRKQLANMVCGERAPLSVEIRIEITKWGWADELSWIDEIRMLAGL